MAVDPWQASPLDSLSLSHLDRLQRLKGTKYPRGGILNDADKKGRTAVLNRLRRIEGQVRGVAQMLEQDRYCIDILYQIQAVKAAIAKVEDQVLADHTASCVDEAIASGDPTAQRKKFVELVDLFGKMKR